MKPKFSIVKTYEKKGYISDPPFKRLLKVLISPKRDELQNMSIGITIISPGEKTKYEAHETSEEILYIISGRGKVIIDDVESKIYPDMLIALPEGAMHQLINTGDESLKLLWIFSPPGPEEHHLDILNKKNNYKKIRIDKANIDSIRDKVGINRGKINIPSMSTG